MKKLLLLSVLFALSLPANAQIGTVRDSIVSQETMKKAALKSDSEKLHYVHDNVNTIYYFDGANTCNFIVKSTYKTSMYKFKSYLKDHQYTYDSENSVYVNGNSKAQVIYKEVFIYLRIYPASIDLANVHASR